VADLFVRDLAALDERSRTHVRSLAATRAHLLSTPPETSKMRFFKNRPLLAVLLVLALVGVASGGAYVVKHAFLTIDPSKSAPEIERDVESQLANEGVTANVAADKSADGGLQLTIMSTDMSLPDKLRDMGAIIQTPYGTSTDQHRIVIEGDHQLNDADQKRLIAVITSHEVVTALETNPADTKAILERALTAAGFTDVELVDAGSDVVIKVKSPPAPPADPPRP